MRLRALGGSGLTASWLGLGTATWGAGTGREAAATQLRAFLDAGGTLVDTADVYGRGDSERILGDLLRSVARRSEVVLASKAGAVPGGAPGQANCSRRHLLATLEQSLRRLGTDHLDLWQLHGWDAGTPLEETLAAVAEALDSGRVRAAGVCNFSGRRTAAAVAGPVPLATAQVEYSLLRRGIERSVLPAVRTPGLGLLAWGPLGRGVLTGKYAAGIPAERQNSRFFGWYVAPLVRAERTEGIVGAVVAAAERLGVAPLSVALSWVRDRPGVAAAIVGARTPAQLDQSLAAADLVLPPDVLTMLDAVSAPDPSPSQEL